MTISTLEETIMLSQNVGRQSPSKLAPHLRTDLNYTAAQTLKISTFCKAFNVSLLTDVA